MHDWTDYILYSYRFNVFLSGHAYKSFIWALEIDDSRIISGDSDASLVVHDFWDYSDSPTCHEPKKTKYSSDSPICHETK